MSEFGQDAPALQRAFDWAHEEHGSLVLDTDVTVRRTVFLGNLHLIDGGGKISLLADATYQSRPDGGTWRHCVILMRSALGNTAFGEPLETQYLVRIEPGCKLEFTRADSGAPMYPARFTGLAEGSEIYLDFTGRSLIDGECNGPNWAFFNRCRIGGNYRLELLVGEPSGGFWFSDHDSTGSGPAFASDFLFDNPVFAKVGGSDECIAIYTASTGPGHLRARGSLSVTQSSGMGFSIFNGAASPPAEFDVALDSVKVRSTVRNGQAVVKIWDGNARIKLLEATVTGVEGEVKVGAAIRCGATPGASWPIINQARLGSEGAGPAGYPGVLAVWGDCAIGSVSVAALPTAT